MGDLRKEIKDEMLKKIKGAGDDNVACRVYAFRDFVSALKIEGEIRTSRQLKENSSLED